MELEEEVRELKQEEEITWSLISAELQDMCKDCSRQPGECIAAWLFRCWDKGLIVSSWKGKKPNSWDPLLETAVRKKE